MRKEWILAAFVAVALVGFLAAPAMAEEAAEEEEGGGVKQVTWLDTIMASGLIGACIIVLSVVTLALVIEHFVNIRQDKIVPPDIKSEIEVLFEDEEYEEAMELCEQEPSFFTNVIGAGLPKMGSGYQAMLNAMGDQIEVENTKLQQKVGYLSVISAIGPMLGLLGTVQGMIMAFQQIASARGAPEPAALANSISLALVTTFEGLIVAIPGTAFYFYFRNRCVSLGMYVSSLVDDLFDRFRPTE